MSCSLEWSGGDGLEQGRELIALGAADGRATFRVEGMWEASLTYGGDNDDADAQWYLLSLKFLFRVRDALGGEALDGLNRLSNR